MQFIPTRSLTAEPVGQFFTPDYVARSLVKWVVSSPGDRLLDPSCGDGGVLRYHSLAKGIEADPYAAVVARQRAPAAQIENDDFFLWASRTKERFECAAGNPPFVRFQKFKGDSRSAATSICEAHGVKLSNLGSAWAAFLVVTATLLKPGGRMAFVVPAEIGHAPYAKPVLQYLTENFSSVHVVAIRDKIFPHLSEDCWLLYCDGFGGGTDGVDFSNVDRFSFHEHPPQISEHAKWQQLSNEWKGRLRPLLLPAAARELYLRVGYRSTSKRLGDFAKINIGYISGDNDFFHLRASEARERNIAASYLIPTVRKGSSITKDVIDDEEVRRWVRDDEPSFLLSLPPDTDLPDQVTAYLDSPRGLRARARFKCRTRRQWYSVPGIVRPCYFLQYMSGADVRLARNIVGAACTNSVLAVRLLNNAEANTCLPLWMSPLTRLSCELEGHPLGGGMLKLEPGEARKVVFDKAGLEKDDLAVALSALETIRSWRHVRSGSS